MSDKIRFQLEMYCQGSIYMTVQWVLGNHKATPETLARFLSESMPAELRDVFKERGLLQTDLLVQIYFYTQKMCESFHPFIYSVNLFLYTEKNTRILSSLRTFCKSISVHKHICSMIRQSTIEVERDSAAGECGAYLLTLEKRQIVLKKGSIAV